MEALFEFPKQAHYGKVVPKRKIYKHAAPSTTVRNLFVQEIGQIIWAYKLSPETTNLPACREVNEIQVFNLTLKTGSIKHEVLRCIDRAIPSPIFFQIFFDTRIQYVAAYKRPGEVDRRKWVVSEYFETQWMPAEEKQKPLPVVLNLGALYQTLLGRVLPIKARAGEKMSDLILRAERVRMKKREAKKSEKRLQKEKQFNRKVEINAKLRDLQKELEILSQ